MLFILQEIMKTKPFWTYQICLRLGSSLLCKHTKLLKGLLLVVSEYIVALGLLLYQFMDFQKKFFFVFFALFFLFMKLLKLAFEIPITVPFLIKSLIHVQIVACIGVELI